MTRTTSFLVLTMLVVTVALVAATPTAAAIDCLEDLDHGDVRCDIAGDWCVGMCTYRAIEDWIESWPDPK